MAEKIQWHPGFYAGMELELKAFDLSFDLEYQMTRGPAPAGRRTAGTG